MQTYRPPIGALAALGRSARFDGLQLRRHARLRAAVLVSLLLPALYALIYLTSIWDPASHTGALPVALVNEDQGVEVQGRRVELGRQLLQGLRVQPAFGYVDMADAETARHAVRAGELAFAVLIPGDFSRLAVPGEQAGAGRLVIYTSEGNNYTGAALARRFAPDLARRVNQTLNEQRWSLVLSSAASSADGVDALRRGLLSLVDSAGRLNTATQQVQTGAAGLAEGSRQLARGEDALRDGLATLEPAAVQLAGTARHSREALRGAAAQAPPAADLAALKAGARDQRRGQQELLSALQQAGPGVEQIRQGSQAIGEEGDKLPLFGGPFVAASQQLMAGADRLAIGLAQATGGAERLLHGVTQLESGIGSLADGVLQLGGSLGQLGANLPGDEPLQTFVDGIRSASRAADDLSTGARRLQAGTAQVADGLGRLSTGSTRLHAGLELVAGRLPAGPSAPGGSPAGLSESVQPVLEVAAPVANQGSGYAPNFIPLALWVGVTLCTFLFSYRALPAELVGGPRLALVLGKLVVPAVLVSGQVLVMLAMLFGVLHAQVDSVPRFVATLWITALAFLALLAALVRILGDAGKLVALVLVVLQLAAAGATMPIELTTPFFQAIHPWLPMTWVVRTLRIAMFGAFEGAWGSSAAVIAAVGAACVAAAALFGRWKAVDPAAYQPPIETD